MENMLENGNKKAERSQDVPETGRRRYCLRVCFIVIVILVLLFCYVDFSTLPESFASTMQAMLNKTDTRQTKYPLPWNLSLTANTTSVGPVTSNILPTTELQEQCMSETLYHVAYPCRYHYVLNEPERCQKEKPFLVLMVPVAPSNKEARDAVRSTWGSEKLVMEKVVRLFFLLGQPGPEGREEQQQKLLKESEEHHDIVQSDFLDSYKNLTIKTMIIMEWLTSYCQNAVYAMKVDSDIFLNVNNLVNMLLQAPKQNYMTGLVARGAEVVRNPHSKWYLPKDVFPEDHYPPYALGLAYVLSTDLPKKLTEAAKHVKAVYIEDVFLGLCMRHLGIDFTIQEDQGLFSGFPVPYDRCCYSRLIATTTNNLEEQVNSWKDVKKPGPTCESVSLS